MVGNVCNGSVERSCMVVLMRLVVRCALTRRASCWHVRAYEVGDGSAPGGYRVPQHQHNAIHSATPGNSAWISFPNRPFGPRTLFIASTCRDSCLYCEDGQEIARHLSVTSHQVHRWPVGLETKVFDMHVWKYLGPGRVTWRSGKAHPGFAWRHIFDGCTFRSTS
jgi:hypothetical protein